MRARFAILAAIALAACSADQATRPTPSASLTIVPYQGAVFERDVITLAAIERDPDGRVVPSPTLTWKSRDEAIALVNDGGQVVTLKPGVAHIEAHSNGLTTELAITVRPLTVLQVSVLGVPETIKSGDVLVFGVRSTGEGGRVVFGHSVALASSDPSVALIDPSGRIRAVSPGTATISAVVNGVKGAANISVISEPVTHALHQLGGIRLPAIAEARTVIVGGAEEKHETWLEWGSLQLTGGADARYATHLHFAEYRVTTDAAGERQLTLLSTQDVGDRGVVFYNTHGDLVMTSEVTPGVRHTSSAIAGGFTMQYRGSNLTAALDLFFRREPD